MSSPFLPDRKLWSMSIDGRVWMTDQTSVLSPLAVAVDPWAPPLPSSHAATIAELVETAYVLIHPPLAPLGATPDGGVLMTASDVVFVVRNEPWRELTSRGLAPRLAVTSTHEGHRHVISWWAEDTLAGVTALKSPKP